MPIPALELDGLLPSGVHDCTLEEIKARFGAFQSSDRRPRLFAKLNEFVAEARASRLVEAVIVDGSFVTAKLAPNDIDLIVVLPAQHDFSADLPLREYNVLSKQRVWRRYRFDVLLARKDSNEYQEYIALFQQVRLAPNQRKGLLRVLL